MQIEALRYFKERQGYGKLFVQFRRKYESLGRIGGAADLAELSAGELEELALFMGASPHHLARKGKLALADFEQRLQQTRFAGISLHELLEAYYGESIQSRKSQQEQLTAAQTAKLEELKQRHPALAGWFRHWEARTADTHWIRRLLLEPDFAGDMAVVAAAYEALPDTVERYPLFSQRVTGNPHELDLGTVRGRLWLHLLHVTAGGQGPPPAQAEQVNELLLARNLLRDDIQNFVTQANLLAFAGGREHPVWRAAAEERSVMNVPMRELLKVDRVTAAASSCREVFVVENSGVFSALLDAVPEAPLICTHGQFKLAGLQLMDRLAEAGHVLCYSGDFDPEGLTMALRFLERYGPPGCGRLWRMTAEDYARSGPSVELGGREGKLAPLLDAVPAGVDGAMPGSALGDIARAMRQRGKIGYQEGIMAQLIQDLRDRE